MARSPRDLPGGAAGGSFRLPPIGVLVIALATTAALSLTYHQITVSRDLVRFEYAAEAVQDRLTGRLETYVALLLATRGLFAASEEVGADEFARFVGRVELQERYPGIQGIGFTRRFPWAEREAVEAAYSAPDRPIRVWPDTPRDEGHAIVFLEPPDRRNRAALGFDMSTEPVRREAMERARDTGGPVASGPVTLVQEIDEEKQAGFLIYLPVYAPGDLPSTVEERRASLTGYAFTPFRAGDLLATVDRSEPRVGLVVTDHGESGPVELYRSPTLTGTPLYQTVHDIPIHGRTWTVQVATLPPFQHGSGTWLTPWLAATGSALSGVLYLFARRQDQATGRLELHSRILARMTEGVSVADDAGIIVYTNPAEDRMFGYAAGELVGRHVSVQNAYPPDENERVIGAVMDAVRRDGLWSGEFDNIRKDGTRFVTSAQVFHLDVEGRRRWVCVQEDVTERRRVEREREELLARETVARAAAEEANRTKDEFLAMLGHELRNPLAPIVTALEVIRRRSDVADPAFAIIERQVRHLRRLVEDLLDVARITRGHVALDLHVVRAADIVDEALELVQPLVAQRGHAVTRDVAADARVRVDRVRMVQVVANLVVNAAKYTDPGGNIAVTARVAGDDVVLTVRDDGMGIPADLLPRLFDLFTQGPRAIDRSEGGLGIGLAVVRTLVGLHGGTITARSAGPGRGSEFEITLPAALPDADAPAVAADPRSAAAPLRILVVDDNVDAAEMLAQILGYEGHDVEIAHDADGALAAAGRSAPDVAILDIGLPGMDGYALAARLPEPRPTLYALTGYGAPTDRARSEEAGFEEHFTKPVDVDRLVEALASVAERRASGG